MSQESGLTIADTQYAICKGVYGGKQWSASDKEAACIKYEELTGTAVHQDSTADSSAWLVGGGILAVLAVLVVGWALFSKKRRT